MPDFTDKITLTPPGSNTPVFAIDLKGNTFIKGVLASPTSVDLFGDGTAAAPSIAFTSNPNRGLFNDTTNSGVGFTVAGTQAAFVSATALSPAVDNTLSLGTSSLRLTTGYFSTSIALGINANATGVVYAGSNANNQITLDTASAVPTNTLQCNSSQGTLAARTDSSNGDIMAIMQASAYSGILTLTPTAKIQMVVDGTFTSNQRPPSKIDFYTNAANGAQTVQVSIDHGGAVRATTSVFVGGDLGTGTASTLALTNAINTTLTNVYKVQGGQATNTVNTGWIKVYVGTVVSWVPYWSNATP